MTLSAGSRLGPYEIVSPLGAGGMGEVYRARDTRIGRDVAIKVLPAAFAADGDRLARFRREAQVLGSLNHPHIAAIYGLEESGGVDALVLELVEGETLAERLARSPLPVEEALAIARQIAEGLEAAHDKGIVHRDLKPANVKLTPDGKVKVLDFGLAKALTGDGSSADVTSSPTLTAAATQAGVVIGTAAYMSPEQARGKAVDKRADIWAFGAVLYEMLTGRRAFEGETVSDTLAAVLTRDPDWSALPAATPVPVLRLLHRSLDRDARQRLRDIGEARIAIETAGVESAAPAAVAGGPAGSPGKTALLAAAGALAAALIMWLVMRPAAREPGTPKRFVLQGLPIAWDVGQSLALSPDGRALVFRGQDDEGYERLYLRSFDAFDTKPIAGTEQGELPFFSPDGRWLGFFASGSLKKISLSGGAPQVVCRAAGLSRGATWMPDGMIVFALADSAGLQRVSSSGGAPQTLFPLDRKRGETYFSTPWALPNGKGVLFGVQTKDGHEVGVFSLSKRERRTLAADGAGPAYAAGHVLYLQGALVLALPFDAERLAATGSPFPAVSGVRPGFSWFARMFMVSSDGTLAFFPQSADESTTLVWKDRKGVETPIGVIKRHIDIPRLSPDGKRVAFRVPGPNCDVWTYDLSRGSATRLTLEGDNHGVVWTPDGRRVTFARFLRGQAQLMSAPVEGGSPEALAPLANNPFPSSCSPDGRVLAYTSGGQQIMTDIFAVSMDGDRQPRPLVQTPFDEAQAAFSPDGRFLAYVSNESGRSEVYVQANPGPGARVQISAAGGTEPVWARGGKDLFFRQGRQMMAADIQTSPELSAGRQRLLFENDPSAPGLGVPNYDVSLDGQRLLMLRARSVAGDVHVVLDWFEDLKRAAPKDGMPVP